MAALTSNFLIGFLTTTSQTLSHGNTRILHKQIEISNLCRPRASSWRKYFLLLWRHSAPSTYINSKLHDQWFLNQYYTNFSFLYPTTTGVKCVLLCKSVFFTSEQLLCLISLEICFHLLLSTQTGLVSKEWKMQN